MSKSRFDIPEVAFSVEKSQFLEKFMFEKSANLQGVVEDFETFCRFVIPAYV
jgi:hypothetical protein